MLTELRKVQKDTGKIVYICYWLYRPPMLTKVQHQKLTHFFNVLDHNRNGTLQEEDFIGVAENLCIGTGIPFDSKEYNRILSISKKLFGIFVQELKAREDSITLEEWVDYWEHQVLGGNDFTLLKYYIRLTTRYIFDLFDQNLDGRISIDEYLDMFTIYRIDVKYSAKSFLRLDSNRDEFISKQELVNAVFDFFVSDDPEAKGNWIFGNWETASPVYNI